MDDVTKPVKLTTKERRALAELAKPVGQRDYSRVHGHTIHALQRKRLFGSNGKPGGALTPAGRAELEVPNIFDNLFAKETAVPKAKKTTLPDKPFAEFRPIDNLFAKETAVPKAKKTTLPDKPFAEFRPIEFIETVLHYPLRERWLAGCDQGGVRLYCTSSPHTHGNENGCWALQVRARVKTRNGGSGKHFAVGTASMSREDLLWLRGLIDAELRRKS
jgi:hypothetical protein